MSVKQNLSHVLDEMALIAKQAGRGDGEISLVVVSKMHSWEEMKAAYELGCRDFGENRLQEALEKMDVAPKDIRWHFIGKLQKNKVAKAMGKFALIHSVDSLELAEKISSESVQRGLVTRVLLEANLSGEKTKGGLSREEWKRCFSQVLKLDGIEVLGLMTMAPLTEDASVIRHTFSECVHLQSELQQLGGRALPTLSMGMSNDYRLAIEEGSTLLRIGSAIFNPT
jgi:pyridoxal phosphate enzyme (YggS family)